MIYGGEYTVNHGDGSLGTNATELVFSSDERIERIEVEYTSHPTNENLSTGMKHFTQHCASLSSLINSAGIFIILN